MNVLRGRRTVDKLMAAVYDKNMAGGIASYIGDITNFVKGHRQALILSSRPVIKNKNK
jgi:hypothetical protein